MRVALIKLEPNELTTRDVTYLLLSVAQAHESWIDVARALAEGRAVAWRVEGRSTTGTIITQVESDMLFVWHVGGEGLWRVSRSIIEALRDIALRNGLKGVRSESTPTIAKLLKRHGFVTPRSVMEWRE